MRRSIPSAAVLFVQSDVSEHTELAWIFNCVARMGELRRMIQFKEKSKGETESVGVGLFTYPVLQAADVLLYQAHRVPVGEDQRQHVELMRDIGGRFNQTFGDTFVLPEAFIPQQGARIMALDDPTQKMSKSAGRPASSILLTEAPEVDREEDPNCSHRLRTGREGGGGQAGADEPPRDLLPPQRRERGGPRATIRRIRATGTSRPRWLTRSSRPSPRSGTATRSWSADPAETHPDARVGRGEGRGGRATDHGERQGGHGPRGWRERRRAGMTAVSLGLDAWFDVSTSRQVSSRSRGMPYEVKLEVFEGPLDLLLHLITRQRVDIYDVSLATITEEYLAALDQMAELDLETATGFLVVAATLLELKSARLLPR